MWSINAVFLEIQERDSTYIPRLRGVAKSRWLDAWLNDATLRLESRLGRDSYSGFHPTGVLEGATALPWGSTLG
jgi:hypothetical protein